MNMKKAVQRLKEKGYKMTNQRKEILTFFNNDDRYLTAKELYEYMEKRFSNISFDTVYRNLHLYKELGILEETELNAEKHFRMNCADHHHHHFICNDCGWTKKINFCPMDNLKSFLQSCQILDHKFEVYGLCPSCQT